jgi:thymidylate kinase
VTVVAEVPVDYRQAFVDRVASVLEDAGVEHVVLHGYGRSRSSDSDLDIVVARSGLLLADACLRSGVLGRLVQVLHYDVPWCRWYVLESEEPGRRFRQLDIACDPWGVGRYGRALQYALTHMTRSDGLRVPAPAAQALYLAVKRAQKEVAGPAEVEALVDAFARDPEGSAGLLEAAYGEAGRRVARGLAGDSELAGALVELRRAVARRRRTPAQVGRRAVYSSARIARRLIHRTGFVVCLAGPDGVGKTTLAEGLEREFAGAFRRAVRLHGGPSLLPPPARILGRQVSDGSEPHGRHPSGSAGSALRLAYLLTDRLVSWPVRIALARRRGVAVVVERGDLDLVVDPHRYRLSLPPRLVGAVTKLMPKPDLTLVLDAPAGRVLDRSDELSARELSRQRDAWRQLASHDAARFAVIDADAPAATVLEQSLQTVCERLARKHEASSSLELALTCLGRPDPRGQRYVVVSAKGRDRWVLPAGPGACGPASTGLYRPTSATRALGAAWLDAGQKLGVVGRRVTLDAAAGVGSAIAAELGLRKVELAGALTGERARGRRALFAVRSGGRTIAFAKIAAEEGGKLLHEQVVLDALRDATERIVAPRVLGRLEWRGRQVLLIEALRTRGGATRELGRLELDAIAEICSLGGLREALGVVGDAVPLHGDFAPWNSGVTADGRLALWDWESARSGLPLEDVFHWYAQRLFYVRRGPAEELVEFALAPSAEVRALRDRLGLDDGASAAALGAYLEWSLGEPSLATDEASDERRRALRLLEERLA